MTREEVELGCRQIVADQLAIPETEIEDESKMLALGADSLDNVEMIMQVEEKFNVHFSDEDAEKITNFEDLVDMTLKLIGEGGGQK